MTFKSNISKLSIFAIAAVLLISVTHASPSVAGTLCVRKKVKVVRGTIAASSAIRISEGACPKGFAPIAGQLQTAPLQGPSGPQGLQGPIGPQGIQGLQGEDGKIRIYGDGSAGDLVINTSSILDPALANQPYQNCYISPGVFVTVSHGVTLRCAGSFVNEGTLVVAPGGREGLNAYFTILGAPIVRTPIGASGFSLPVTAGIFSNTASFVLGGSIDLSMINEHTLRSIKDPVLAFGGGGSAGFSSANGSYSLGGAGGGGFLVLARGPIVNSAGAVIRSNGSVATSSSGGGGGAGGVIILASPQSVSNNGSIQAMGAGGSSATSNVGAGGGGGGGFVHFFSPVVNQGSVVVTGGQAGTIQGGLVASTPRMGGGAGGSCIGVGGGGGSISAGGGYGGAGNGSPGSVVQTNADPTFFF